MSLPLEWNWVIIYHIYAQILMMGSLGVVFLVGVMNISDLLARPHLYEGQPRIPAKRLLATVAGLVAFYLLSLAWPPSGPADDWQTRLLLVGSMLFVIGSALPAWRLAFNRSAEKPGELAFPWDKFARLVAVMVAWDVAFTLAFPDIKVAEGFLEHLNLDNPYLLFLVGGVAIIAPISEEIVYRGIVQPFFSRFFKSALPPIMIAGYLWAVSHVGMIDPPGLKEFQIMGLALIFGYARNTFGLGSAILLHLVNNSLVLILQWVLLFSGIEAPK